MPARKIPGKGWWLSRYTKADWDGKFLRLLGHEEEVIIGLDQRETRRLLNGLNELLPKIKTKPNKQRNGS